MSSNPSDQSVDERFAEILSRGLSLDMTRGKPSPEQLDLSSGLLESLTAADYRAADGTDCRNYGGLEGLPEARALLAPMLDVAPDDVLVQGNASLQLMHGSVVQALLEGVPGGNGPWAPAADVRFLCPSPGYDRHFTICESLGIEMVTVGMDAAGPDMEAVCSAVSEDPRVKGIWCVPRYSNPTGVTYSAEVISELASMKTAAPDFRIFWDNAYAVHHLYDEPDPLPSLLDAARAAGNEDRVLMFGSTSKVTFAGAGVALFAASEANRRHLLGWLGNQTIGPDKLNQLRHVRFFGDFASIERHMRSHAEIIRPKFEAVDEVLTREMGGGGVTTWSRPRGGYFVSLDVPDGCAKRTVALAAEAGVKLTGAGATYPGKRDPFDRNIRIAPTLPSLADVRQAMEVLAVCVLKASAERP